MRPIVLSSWPLWPYDIFTQYLPNGTIFGGGGDYYCLLCFDFLYTFCLKHFLFYEDLARYYRRFSRKLPVRF